MARILIKVLHDAGDSDGGLVIVQDGKELPALGQGDSREYVLAAGGLNIRAKAVDDRGVPIGNRPEPHPEIGMSRTDPRSPAGGAQPGGQTSTSGAMARPPTGGPPTGPATPPNPPARQGLSSREEGNA